MSPLQLALSWLSIISVQGKSFVVKRDISEAAISSKAFNAVPTITKFYVSSSIEFRYATTLVESHVKNPGSTAQKVSFSAIIPNSAFISNFIMVIDGTEYIAKVQKKEEAKESFNAAVAEGTGAGLVTQDVRDSNLFTITTNVEAEAKMVFKLTYEELLERKLGWYQHVININPGQIVNDLKIVVKIDESRPLAKLSVPELKESNDIDFKQNQENNIAKVVWKEGTAIADIGFAPNKQQQEDYGDQGLAGQLLIKYDVERDDKDNEVQVIDGYFVHYFTPENLDTLPKHVIFVLDVSGSMLGEKIVQLKDAMFTILNDMTERDYFNIITFSSSFNHWQAPQAKKEKFAKRKYDLIQANADNRKEAIKYTNKLRADGYTNINDGLLEGLKLAEVAMKNEHLPTNLQSIIVFLSDGEPTEGITEGHLIRDNVREANLELKVPIYSLGFGRDADFNLIKQISAEAYAFSKHIYEGSDAAFQLEDFFAEIASPLLSNLKFNYVGGLHLNNSTLKSKLIESNSISQSDLRTFFKGGEFVITGKLDEGLSNQIDILEVTVTAAGENGTSYNKTIPICLKPCIIFNDKIERNILYNNDTKLSDGRGNNDTDTKLSDISENQHEEICPSFCKPQSPPPPRSHAQNFLQNLHAFLNIKQLLKRTDKVAKEKALSLALNNNFVTELTSLVVVGPNETAKISAVTEHGSQEGQYNYLFSNIQPVSADDYYDEYAGMPEVAYDGGVYPPKPTNCSGSIRMFSKTYFRGESITLTNDTLDLSVGDLDFDNKVVSILVEGTCCWDVFTESGFEGKHVRFSNNEFTKGLYKSTTSVYSIFREASSVKRVIGC